MKSHYGDGEKLSLLTIYYVLYNMGIQCMCVCVDTLGRSKSSFKFPLRWYRKTWKSFLANPINILFLSLTKILEQKYM